MHDAWQQLHGNPAVYMNDALGTTAWQPKCLYILDDVKLKLNSTHVQLNSNLTLICDYSPVF